MRRFWDSLDGDWLEEIRDTILGFLLLGLIIGIPVAIALICAASGYDTAGADGTFPGGPDGMYKPESEHYGR
jgi:hypothetical protein